MFILSELMQSCVCIFYVLNRSPFFFFFNDTATTEIYTLSLHDALPISEIGQGIPRSPGPGLLCAGGNRARERRPDRKSTRLNSSHANISYAVFCLKKKKTAIACQRDLKDIDAQRAGFGA